MRIFKIEGRVLGAAILASAALALSAALTPPAATIAQATTTPKPHPPRAVTGAVDYKQGSSALLEGSVDPGGAETSYYFQYGPTTAYGAQTPSVAVGSGTTAVKVGRAVSGLTLGVTYHYRIVATNASGETAAGRDRTFTPAGIKLRFSLVQPSAPVVFGSKLSVSGVLSGTGSADQQVVLQADPFPYLGNFTDVGAPQVTNAAGGFSFPVPSLSQSTQFRVITLGLLPVYSSPITERVAVRVSLRAIPTGRKGYERFAGTVTPAEVGKTVVFQWLKPGHNPVSAGSAKVKRGTARISRFSGVVFIRDGRGGAYRAFVKLAEGAQVSGSSSSVIVHSAPAPVRKR